LILGTCSAWQRTARASLPGGYHRGARPRDWHTAEDLTQIALTKTLLAWRRISRQENAHAYAHRTLVNAYLGQRRTRKSGEVPVSQLP